MIAQGRVKCLLWLANIRGDTQLELLQTSLQALNGRFQLAHLSRQGGHQAQAPNQFGIWLRLPKQCNCWFELRLFVCFESRQVRVKAGGLRLECGEHADEGVRGVLAG